MNERVLIVAAHLDDFELGMGGTAATLSQNYPVEIVVMCQGDRPGHEFVGSPRRVACRDNVKMLGASLTTYRFSDTKLDLVSQTELCDIIHKHVTDYEPTIVYTHHEHDVHKDHRIMSHITRVACRPRSCCPVNTLLEYSIPGSTEWGQASVQFNTFQDITQHSDIKMEMISKYKSELRPSPDPVSLEMIEARDRYHGSLCGYSKAEMFRQIYRR